MAIKIGRNDPCPCGSGKKFKRCCDTDHSARVQVKRAAAKADSLEEAAEIMATPPDIYSFEVSLIPDGSSEDSHRETTKTIEINGDKSLYNLHMAIQKAFGWDNDHMFSFFLDNKIESSQYEYSGDPLGQHHKSFPGDKSRPADGVEIADLRLKKGGRFTYLYDYGDNIEHSVELIDIRGTEKNE
ncbi:MAG: SEC-C domain-containing protein [Spirochaetia bacterium]|nr:SEC-C domain-containing protein [Spirochaetia bacterium]